MGTSGEKVRTPDEAERVQLFSYPHIRLLSVTVLYMNVIVSNAN